MAELSKTTDAPDLRKALAALVLDDHDFREMERQLNVFCPFEALGVVKAEIRHAHFLAHSLDPAAPHGFGAAFLRAFLSEVADVTDDPTIDRMRIHLADIEDTEVRREVDKMDLAVVIEAEKLVVVIELKVDAGEGAGQLRNYHRRALETWPPRDGWHHIFIFLTPDGRKPTDPSWHAMGYGALTAAADALLDGGAEGVAGARALMKAYASMLRRRHMDDEALQKLARDLWRRHKSALSYLVEQAPDAAGGFARFVIGKMDELANLASIPNDLTLVPDRGVQNYINFGVLQWDELPGMKDGKGWTRSGRVLMLELNIRPNFIDQRFLVGPAPQELRDRLVECISQARTDRLGKAKKWTQVVRRRIKMAVETLEQEQFDESFNILADNMRKFVNAELKPLDGAIRRAAVPTQAPEGPQL